MDDLDIELNEMELIAAAGGYYYYNTITKQPRSSPPEGGGLMNEVLGGNDDPGWEVSVADSRVLRAVLDDPDQNFPHIPEGKYYLVGGGYSNTRGFVSPYPGVRYQRHEFLGADQLHRNMTDKQVASTLRDSTDAAMWNDFLNNWDEW